jgi:6-phosphogluconate dehydrogenase (decarboxylating)
VPEARWICNQGHPCIAGLRGISRVESRDMGAFTGKMLSAMRSEFGCYAEK